MFWMIYVCLKSGVQHTGCPVLDAGRLDDMAVTPCRPEMDESIWMIYVNCIMQQLAFGARFFMQYPSPQVYCSLAPTVRYLKNNSHNVFIMNAFYGVITIRMECSTWLTFFSIHSPPHYNYETLVKSRLSVLFAELLEHFLKQDKNILESLSYNTVNSLSRMSPLSVNA